MRIIDFMDEIREKIFGDKNVSGGPGSGNKKVISGLLSDKEFVERFDKLLDICFKCDANKDITSLSERNFKCRKMCNKEI